MARKPVSAVAQAKAAAAAKKRGGGGGMGVNKAVVLTLMAALVPFSLPSVIILGLTMLPTAAAYVTERGANRYAWLCVGGLNFAGVVPYLFGLWFGVHTIDEAMRILSDASVLLWAYGAAMIGWAIYKGTPPLVENWLKYSSERRVSGLKAAQRKLVEEFGEDVSKKGAKHEAAAVE